MATDDFMKQQYLTLRDEIRESKARIFWLLILGMLLVMAAGYLAAEHPSAFANAAIPFLLIGLMLSCVSEQNNIARAGRYLRETVEPRIQDLVGWEHWLESKPRLREVDHAFAWSALMTGVAFAAVGGMKSRFVDQTWWRSALETVAVGGLALLALEGSV